MEKSTDLELKAGQLRQNTPTSTNRNLKQRHWLQCREVGEVDRPESFVILLRDLHVSPIRSGQLRGVLAPPHCSGVLSDHVNVFLPLRLQQPVSLRIIYRDEIGKL